MKKIDIIIPAMLIITMIVSGVFFLQEYAEEQKNNLTSKLIDNINGLTIYQTDCIELSKGIDDLPISLDSYDDVMKALKFKHREMGC